MERSGVASEYSKNEPDSLEEIKTPGRFPQELLQLGGACPVCGYPVNRNASGCPECGSSSRLSPAEAVAVRKSLGEQEPLVPLPSSPALPGWSGGIRAVVLVPGLVAGGLLFLLRRVLTARRRDGSLQTPQLI